jgi:hypothetical protein
VKLLILKYIQANCSRFLDACVGVCYYLLCALKPWKHVAMYIVKVEALGAAHSTRSTLTHANSYRICALAAQKDCSGCGACRMATVYRSLGTIRSTKVF